MDARPVKRPRYEETPDDKSDSADIEKILQKVSELIKTSRKILVLTGAGISVSCGIPDFRSSTGLYADIAIRYPDLEDPQLLFDIHYFRFNHKPFFELARKIFPSEFVPSPTHRFIRHLEERSCLLRNYTQNIDTLERIAGISNVIFCHGSFEGATCLKCQHSVDCEFIRSDILSQKVPYCPVCLAREDAQRKLQSTKKGTRKNEDYDDVKDLDLLPILKPNITFFGESLPQVFAQNIGKDLSQADLMIVMGSSLKVAPVNQLLKYVPENVPVIFINREITYHCYKRFDYILLGYCDVIIQKLSEVAGFEFDFASKTPVFTQSNEADGSKTSDEPEVILDNLVLFKGAQFNAEIHELINSGAVALVSSSDDEEEGSESGAETEPVQTIS